jgi:cytosine/adenosine deaminase-related metal-dependent hydrolase
MIIKAEVTLFRLFFECRVPIGPFFGYTFTRPTRMDHVLQSARPGRDEMPESTIHTAAWLINPDRPPIEGGAVLVQDGMVMATGTLSEVKARSSAAVVEHHDCAILPGFVNAHTHLELTHFPSWRLRTHVDYNPRTFSDWIIQLIKITRGLHIEDFRASLVEGLRKCVESGTTAVGDIVSHYELLPSYASSPLGGRLYFEALGQEPTHYNQRLSLALKAAKSLRNRPLHPGLSPHTPYTTGDVNLRLIRDVAAARHLPLAIHVSESQAESDFIFDSSGPLAKELYPFVGWEQHLTPPRHCSSTELLDRLKLLTPFTMAVHCVHVTFADVQILKQRGVTVCLCPRSNDRLDVGRASLSLFKKMAIPLALGTDSLASNDSISLWDEMRFALDLFADELSPSDVFRMATSGGAAALGLSESLGSLEAGKRADFQIVRHAGHEKSGLLERVIGQGRIADVCIGGTLGSTLP